MEVKHAVQLSANLDTVWEFLSNVPKVAQCIPNVENVQEIEPRTRFSARMADRVGPFKVAFALDIGARYDEASHTIVLTVKGQDPITRSRVQVSMRVQARPLDPDRTELDVTGETEILGKLGTLGQPMVRRKTTDVMQEFGARVQAAVGGNGGQAGHAS